VAAWGRATKDGRLVTGSSGDHELMHMAAGMAFPETGNNFVFIPVCGTGDIRNAAHLVMLGHPGMNNRGPAHREHGGEPRIAEPPDTWGYGLRKGSAIFHLLRFASSAKEARQLELSYPVGDVGTFMGSVGGFWADRTYGYVPERRTPPVVVRE